MTIDEKANEPLKIIGGLTFPYLGKLGYKKLGKEVVLKDKENLNVDPIYFRNLLLEKNPDFYDKKGNIKPIRTFAFYDLNNNETVIFALEKK